MSSKSRGPGSGWRWGKFLVGDEGRLKRDLQATLGNIQTSGVGSRSPIGAVSQDFYQQSFYRKKHCSHPRE